MEVTQLSPDEVIYWEAGFVQLNATIVFTWGVMAVMILAAWLASRRLATSPDVPKGQNVLEVVVEYIRDQIREVIGGGRPDPYLPFIGTLFLFIAVANLFTILPGYIPPTSSLSTTAALAGAVFLAVPVYAIASQGAKAYLRRYLEPTPIMLPFTVLGELSRTLALAVRLFGNMMSAAKIGAILLAVIPFLFPIIFQALGLLTGMVQAYIFAVLAMVYIASGMSVTENPKAPEGRNEHPERSNH